MTGCHTELRTKALETLSGQYPMIDIPGGCRFALDGYDVDVLLRSESDLIVGFAPRNSIYPAATEAPAWGEGFLKKLGVSAFHVRPKKSCWYLGRDLQGFMRSASSTGLFSTWSNVMTYGGSMGGFAALAYARTVSARRVLSMNPQLNLGPSVRTWEDRFPEALEQDWTSDLTRIEEQVRDVETLVLVYDPYHRQDRRQVDLMTSPHAIRLKIPFVGHMMATHMKDLSVLGPVFRQTLRGEIDVQAFYRQIRGRRHLPRYRSRMTGVARGARKTALSSIFAAESQNTES